MSLAEYLADMLPDAFTGNESAAEVEASPIWKDVEHNWIAHQKVRGRPLLCIEQARRVLAHLWLKLLDVKQKCWLMESAVGT